jgi:Domain of unknown function (DUF4350)
MNEKFLASIVFLNLFNGVLFTENHDEGYGIYSEDATELTHFSQILEDNGILVKSIKRGVLDEDVLGGVSAVIISYPEKEMTAGEIQNIVDYVSNGGSLIVLGGGGASNQINPLIERFGLLIYGDVVEINSSNYLYFRGDESGHEIFTYVEDYTPILTPRVYAKDPDGIILITPKLGRDKGIFALKKYGKGKVFVSADADFLSNIFVHKNSNAQLGLNIVNYMTGNEIKKIELKKGGRTNNTYFWSAFIVVLALSLFVYLRRRQ